MSYAFYFVWLSDLGTCVIAFPSLCLIGGFGFVYVSLAAGVIGRIDDMLEVSNSRIIVVLYI